MVARFTGGMLGLLAFGIATLAGLSAGNPADVILTRALASLVLFCVIGLVLGFAAQTVINEYMARKEAELFPEDDVPGDSVLERESSTPTAEPVATE